MAKDGLFIGLMSGTSVDAIDAALIDCSAEQPRLIHTHSSAIPDSLRNRVLALCRGESDSLHALGTLDNALGERFAQAVLDLLSAAKIGRAAITAIGSHGQTVRHCPPGAGQSPYTLQIADPNIIAERTGILTVADFRRRDMAAGGEGAPLVPRFHGAVFGRAGERRAVVNIGGIANATLLHGDQVVAGFDCGPGNTLLDAWINDTSGERFDNCGAWSAEHRVDDALLQQLMCDPWFQRRGPRSTGPEYFNLAWLRAHMPREIDSGSVQATLAELTARGIAESLAGSAVTDVWVCGGGAANTDLMRRLHRLLEPTGCRVATTSVLGIDPQWVEAAAFAWLARQRLQSKPGNAPTVTGAAGPRVLGAVFAASSPVSQAQPSTSDSE